ncbi:MAG: FAD-dependent oxidoreductase [Deltaproteobacteria bacterium]|nr:FAD-dependent oxidoreductase [Deltaproteobacteria bacterium]
MTDLLVIGGGTAGAAAARAAARRGLSVRLVACLGAVGEASVARVEPTPGSPGGSRS